MYALRASNPSPEKKLTNPGPEALALLGLSRYPVFAGRERTATQGCSGKWKDGYYSWPLWRRPASSRVVKSLLAHAYDHGAASNRHRWYGSWGVAAILRSPIRRSDQGGYGTFGPPAVTWQQAQLNGWRGSTAPAAVSKLLSSNCSVFPERRGCCA